MSLDSDRRDATQPADASEHVSTDSHENDDHEGPYPLPELTPELFIFAGAIAAEHAGSEHAAPSQIEEILRRAVAHSTVLRGEEG